MRIIPPALLASSLLVVGVVAHASTPIPDASFDVGFSPRAGAQDVVLSAINSAQREILVAAYSFTSKPVALALLAAARRGVKVAVVADAKANSGRYSAAQFLANKDLPVRLNDHFAILHDKFLVIDRKSVELGSFNYSAAANAKNAENALLLHNVEPLAQVYLTEWRSLWEGGEDLPAKY